MSEIAVPNSAKPVPGGARDAVRNGARNGARSGVPVPVQAPAAPASLLDRALARIASVWRDMAAAVGGEDEGIEAQMQACLAGRGGEVSARNRAARLAQSYLARDDAGRREFLSILATFDAPAAAIRNQAAELADNDPLALARLRRTLEPPRRRLLTQFTSIPDGMRFLVDLRAALLALGREDQALAALEDDLKTLLAGWFDIGFLELRQIDWSSPASLLEKLVGYEAVHEIRSWRDLKNRLDSDRRCYAFFHPRMPTEPLIFVEVALVAGIAGSIQRLLDTHAPAADPARADSAIFYSISNCQRGLNGISFGNFLIKRVVDLLSQELPNLRHFATLSPIPGLRAWLDKALAAEPGKLLSAEELVAIAGAEGLAATLERRAWPREPATVRLLEPILPRLAARYLLGESRGARALDPVAHFHLANGASVERINWLADTSDKGLRESAGLMVNYLYDPERIDQNHEDYAGEGKRNASTAVRRLARARSGA